MRIDKLTDAQSARFSEWVDKWIKVGLSTEPADFDRATEAALKAYRLCNLKRPMVILLRMGSPYAATLGGAIAWVMLRELFGKKASQVWSQVWSQVRSQVESQVRSQVESQVRSQVGSQVWSQVESQVWSQVESAPYNSGCGALWASWAAYVSFLRDVCGWRDEILERFEIDEALVQSCGWTWWHENVLAISDRPCALNRDERGRLHCATGPSIAYRDGWKLYHWHGVLIPEYVIERPADLSISRIESEQNTEVRRVMVERYGQERFLIDAGAELVHKDTFGELYRREIAGDEPLVMVKVRNSTPEPDGSIKDYFLRVPPTIRTAQGAVAWTFGLKKKRYQPAIET